MTFGISGAGFTGWHNIGTSSLHVFAISLEYFKKVFLEVIFLVTIPYSQKSSNYPVRHCIASIVGRTVLKMRRCQGSGGQKYICTKLSANQSNRLDSSIQEKSASSRHWRVPRWCKSKINKNTFESSFLGMAKRFGFYWKFRYILVLVQWCNGACNMPLDAPFPNVWAVLTYQWTIYRRFHQMKDIFLVVLPVLPALIVPQSWICQYCFHLKQS